MRVQRCWVLLIAAATLAAPPLALADDPSLPKTLAEAVSLERADALPRTAFYEPPPLAGSVPGALLRQESFTGYSLPPGASAVRILYHSQDADGRDVATSGVVLVPAGAAPTGGWPVIAGESDETVPIGSVRATVRQACRNGIALQFRSYPGLDHDPTMAQSTPDQLEWLRERLAGKPFAPNCAALESWGGA